jgi:hypothetical protein
MHTSVPELLLHVSGLIGLTGLKHVGVSGYYNIIVTLVQLCAFVALNCSKIPVTFINQLMHSIITVIDVKVLLYKSL